MANPSNPIDDVPSSKPNVALSRLVTLAWGVVAVAFSFSVEHIADTILEAINKIGSLANGPLLALFIIAVLRPAWGPRRTVTGFVAGIGVNAYLWIFVPELSWLWWNVVGCIVALVVASIPMPHASSAKHGLLKHNSQPSAPASTLVVRYVLIGAFFTMTALLAFL